MADHILLLLLPLLFAVAACDGLLITPAAQAQVLIRQLNLLPSDQDVEPEMGEGDDGGSIVERRFELPGLAEDNEDLGHHAGYYRLPNTYGARMFYLFFESRNSKSDPMVIWLTGGPGCSSELALFYENGPFIVEDDMSLRWNEYGWDKASNLLYVDQPTGTGFSYTTDERDVRHNEKGVSEDLYHFLQAFFKAHPEYAKNDFYITGESYAGHYIPAFASRVHQGNKAKEGIHINLKGFAIGNGLTDPAIQYKAYTDYALEMKIIEESDYKRINNIVPTCELAIKLCGTSGTAAACVASYTVCNSIFSSIMKVAGDTNYYDIRKKCEGDLCYDFSNMEKYLNLKSVRDSLGVGNIKFVSCSPTVYQAMITDWMKIFEVGIPALVEDGVKMLIYAGEYDLICNWLGNSRWVRSMEWSGQEEFAAAPTVPFLVNGTEAGLLKTHGPVSFLKIHNAGHMVPMDQPMAALAMLKRWTNGRLTDTIELKLENPVADM